MLDDRTKYLFVSQDAMKRIAIEGMPYPARGSKLVRLGEDIAFILEAIGERLYYASGSTYKNSHSSLSITQSDLRIGNHPILRLYDYTAFVQDLLNIAGGWMFGDDVEEFSHATGCVVSNTYDYFKSRGDSDAATIKNECNSDLGEYLNTLNAALTTARQTLRTAITTADESMTDAIASARSTRNSAYDRIDTALQSNLEALESSYNARVENIREEYEDDPEGMKEALLDAADEYCKDVASERMRAGRERREADSECQSATWEAESRYYEATKAAWAECKEACDSARSTYNSSCESRKSNAAQALASIAASKNVSSWIAFTTNSDGYYIDNGKMGWEWSETAWNVDKGHVALSKQSLEVVDYLSKTPSSAIGITDDLSKAALTCISHMPSAKLMALIYSDLGYMTARRVTATVYRSAFRSTYNYVNGSTGQSGSWYSDFDERVAAGSFIQAVRQSSQDHNWNSIEQNHDESNDSWTNSNNDFFIYYGKRHEVERIKKIYATIRLASRESAYGYPFAEEEEGDEGRRYIDYNTYAQRKEIEAIYLQRIELTKVGIQESDALSAIDGIADTLMNTTLPELKAAYDSDIAALREALDEQTEALTETYYTEPVEQAEATRTAAKQAADAAFRNSVLSGAAQINTQIFEAEDDEGKASILHNFWDRTVIPAQRTRDAAYRSADSQYESAEYAASRNLSTQISNYRRRTYNPAVNSRTTTYNQAVSSAKNQAETAINRIKSANPKANENARCKWRFTVSASGINTSQLSNVGETWHRMEDVWFLDILYLDVVYDMRTSTATGQPAGGQQ